MSKHIEESQLFAFIRKGLSQVENHKVEEHLAVCNDCYAHYLSLLSFEQERKEKPSEEFLKGILDRVSPSNSGEPVHRFRARFADGRWSFFDETHQDVSAVSEPVPLLSSSDIGRKSAGINVRLGEDTFLLQVRTDDAGEYAVSIGSAKPQGISVTLSSDGREIESFGLTTRSEFQSRLFPGSFLLLFRGEKPVGSVLLTLEEG